MTNKKALLLNAVFTLGTYIIHITAWKVFSLPLVDFISLSTLYVFLLLNGTGIFALSQFLAAKFSYVGGFIFTGSSLVKVILALIYFFLSAQLFELDKKQYLPHFFAAYLLQLYFELFLKYKLLNSK